jgi:Domain of unknown function (DUF6362)
MRKLVRRQNQHQPSKLVPELPTLDQAHATRSPAIWTGDLVRQRLVEAYETYRKMPLDRFGRTSSSSWPATPLHSFTDMLHWTNPGDGARERNWQAWEKAKGAFPEEVSRMEQALDWLLWLDQDARRKLDAFAWCKATGMKILPMCKKRGFPKTTYYRDVNNAANRIALRLNGQGVQVR